MLSICISVVCRIVLIKTHVVPSNMVSTPWSVHCGIVTAFYYSSNDSNYMDRGAWWAAVHRVA